jgi:hypothetical protein
LSPLWLARSSADPEASGRDSSEATLGPVTEGEWDRWIGGCPDALLFHTSDWLRMLAGLYGMTWRPLGVWHGGELVGLFPLLLRRLGPFRLAGSPLMQAIASTPFMGPVVPPSHGLAALAALDPVLHDWKVDHIEIALPSMIEDACAAMHLGYTVETCQTVVLDLAERTPEQLWGGLSSACRRAVRKAEANDVQVATAQDPSFLYEYWDMCQEVYRGSGRPPHLGRAFYESAWQALAAKGLLRVLLAARRGEVLAGAIFLLYRERAYYLSGASHAAGLAWRPNNLIQWRFIQWAATNGYQFYDLGGATVPSITRFKQSLGAQLQPFTRLHRAQSAWARWGREAYVVIIPVVRRLQAGALFHALGRDE